jgi:hypothetical protein
LSTFLHMTQTIKAVDAITWSPVSQLTRRVGLPTILEPLSLYPRLENRRPPEAAPTTQHELGEKIPAVDLCGICLVDLDLTEKRDSDGQEDMVLTKTYLELPCQHRFCRTCFTNYIRMLATSPHSAAERRPTCQVCMRQLTLNTIRLGVSDIKVWERYEQMILLAALRSFGSALKFCPRPGCTSATLCEAEDGCLPFAVSCQDPQCSMKICFLCGEQWDDAHEGRTCAKANEIRKSKNPDLAALATWSANSGVKNCPKCNVRVEKNGGCNHMTCSQCSFQYCWTCLKNWSGHPPVCPNELPHPPFWTNIPPLPGMPIPPPPGMLFPPRPGMPIPPSPGIPIPPRLVPRDHASHSRSRSRSRSRSLSRHSRSPRFRSRTPPRSSSRSQSRNYYRSRSSQWKKRGRSRSRSGSRSPPRRRDRSRSKSRGGDDWERDSSYLDQEARHRESRESSKRRRHEADLRRTIGDERMEKSCTKSRRE